MNLLFARLDWDSVNNNDSVAAECDSFKKDNICLYATRIYNDSKAIFYSKEDKVICAMIGYIQNLEDIKLTYGIDSSCDIEIITKLYLLKRLDFIKDLDGVFLIFIFEEDTKKGYIFQDEYGFNLPIYYIFTKDAFLFGTSLKYILKNSGLKRELNIDAVYDFLHFKFIIPNESTLIKNINKLAPLKYIAVDIKTRSFIVGDSNITVKKLSKKTAKKNLTMSVRGSIARLLKQSKREKSAFLSLSSGFDSNLLLNFLRESIDFLLTAATIGGIETNEIPQVSLILKNYSGIKHITNVIKEDMLEFFPDIVWKLEGCVCEIGIFLQYELGRILKEKKCASIFVGDCANEILSYYHKKAKVSTIFTELLVSFKYFIKKTILKYKPYGKKELQESVELTEFKRYLHSLQKRSIKKYSIYPCYAKNLYWIFKKSGIMFNSFGIQGLYPFLNKETRAISKALRLDTTRNFYKQEVIKTLNPNIAQYLTSAGGRTDIRYLFTKEKKDMAMKILNSEFINRILGKSQADTIVNNSKFYFADYHTSNFILLLLYLYIFNELFITGKYDSRFDQDKLDVSLNELLA